MSPLPRPPPDDLASVRLLALYIQCFSVAEAKALAKALPSVKIIGATLVPIKRLRPNEFFGSGKVAELAEIFKLEKIDLVIINSLISPIQQRNLEKELNVKKKRYC